MFRHLCHQTTAFCQYLSVHTHTHILRLWIAIDGFKVAFILPMECLYYVLQNANPNVPSLIYVMFIHDKENALNFYVPTRLHKTPKCTMRIHRANRWCIIANSDVARAIISFFFFFFDFLRILAGGPRCLVLFPVPLPLLQLCSFSPKRIIF